jgi:hypothetical protein
MAAGATLSRPPSSIGALRPREGLSLRLGPDTIAIIFCVLMIYEIVDALTDA